MEIESSSSPFKSQKRSEDNQSPKYALLSENPSNKIFEITIILKIVQTSDNKTLQSTKPPESGVKCFTLYPGGVYGWYVRSVV